MYRYMYKKPKNYFIFFGGGDFCTNHITSLLFFFLKLKMGCYNELFKKFLQIMFISLNTCKIRKTTTMFYIELNLLALNDN